MNVTGAFTGTNPGDGEEEESVRLVVWPWVTFCDIGVALDPPKLLSPVYEAAMECDPAVNEVSVQIATPADEGGTAEHPAIDAELSVKATVPVMGVPPDVNPMVAVSVTDWLTEEELGDAARVRLVLSALTLCCKMGVPVPLGL